MTEQSIQKMNFSLDDLQLLADAHSASNLAMLIFAFIPTLILTILEVLGIVETLVKGEVRNNHNKVNMQLRAALFGQTVFTGVQVFGNTAGGFLWVVYTQDGCQAIAKVEVMAFCAATQCFWAFLYIKALTVSRFEKGRGYYTFRMLTWLLTVLYFPIFTVITGIIFFGVIFPSGTCVGTTDQDWVVRNHIAFGSLFVILSTTLFLLPLWGIKNHSTSEEKKNSLMMTIYKNIFFSVFSTCSTVATMVVLEIGIASATTLVQALYFGTIAFALVTCEQALNNYCSHAMTLIWLPKVFREAVGTLSGHSSAASDEQSSKIKSLKIDIHTSTSDISPRITSIKVATAESDRVDATQ